MSDLDNKKIVKIKYNMYEVIESYNNGLAFKIVGLISKAVFDVKYGNRKILSIQNYDDTKTTSIIIEGE